MIKPSTLSFQKVYFFKNWFFFKILMKIGFQAVDLTLKE